MSAAAAIVGSRLLSRTVALVTGGSSGLGAATAEYLVQHGARVVVADLNPEPLPPSHFSYEGKMVFSPKTDVTNEEHVMAALDQVESAFGEPLNAVVSCAGIAVAKRTLSKKGNHPHSLEDFSRTIMVNTIGTFNVARLAAERMSQRNADENGLRGCIINTASIAAYEGQIGQVAYAASKGGVVGMTLPMARDLAPLGIRVMTIAPGLFSTPLLEGLPDAVREELGKIVPCPSRLGRPEEFAELVGSILTIPTLNGSVIRLDGALRMPP